MNNKKEKGDRLLFFGLWSKRYLFPFLTALFFIAAVILNQWNPLLAESLRGLEQERLINLDLSSHKTERLREYQGILNASPRPETKWLEPNEWIREIQTRVTRERLSLRELRPVYLPKAWQTGSGEKIMALSLELEGGMPDILRFLYGIAQAGDLIYVREFVLSSKLDRIHAQITLSQVKGTAV